MIKRVLKRSFSIFLTLVLIATTFFIFDPSVLRLDASALIGVETNPGLASITTPQAVAPETAYLKPGANEFQYFSNINVTDGVAAGSKDATGTVSYKDQSSTDTKLYVNNLWHKVGKTGDTYEPFAISNLELGITGGVGAQQSITLAGLSAANSTPVAGATVIGRGSNSATAVLNTSSRLKNATRGDVYMIEWAAVSTINGTKHVKFMYTGIYVPLLTITGATANGKHTTALTNVPKAAGFGFVTGAMAYAEKGNRTTAYTGTTAGVNCAPLVKFVGQQNNGNDYTIPNCNNGYSSTTSFPDSTPKTIMVVSGTYDANPNGNNYDVWTTYSSWGSYASPVPTGANHGDVGKNGQTDANVYAGVAYEVVDTSRFTDFSQIPNLSAGFIRYYHDRGGDDASLAWVRCSDAPDADAPSNGVGCVGVDSSDHDDNEDEWRSRTYGLYSFGGAVPTSSKGMYVMFRYNQDITVYNYPIQLNIGVGLHITSVNKDAQRKGYCAYLTSVVDNVNDTSYSTTYGSMLTQARRLCDPTCTDAGTVSGCTKTEIETKSSSIIEENSGALYFRVPETIYITPSNNNFQYYVNNAAQDTMSADATPEATSGTFYFHYKGASKVTALYVESVSGAGLSSMTLGGQNLSGGKINIASVSGASTANINTTITAGSLSAHSDAKLKWTLYYVDKATKATQSVVAYTYCHVPLANAAGNNSNTVISVTVSPNYEAAFHTNTYVCGTAWATGLYSVDSSGTGSDGNGSYKRNWLYNRNQAVPTNGNKNVSDVYNSGIGGSGYWSTNDNVSNVVGGTGTLYVDSSRYTDVGQIPDFYVGIDCNNADSKTRALYVSTGWSTSSQTIVGGDASTNRSEGWSSGGVHPSASITKNTTTDQTLYIQQWCRSWPDSTRTGTGWCYVNIHYRNKADLRTAYDYYLQNAPIINPDYFTGTKYSDMMGYLDTVTTYLCDPENTTAQSTMETAAANLYNAVAAMAGAVTKLTDDNATSTTFSYANIKGTAQNDQSRSTYLNSSTAYNKHYSTRTNALISGQGTNPESINYFYGDTVYADKNDYQGYTFKYAEVTKPFDGAAICNNRSSFSNSNGSNKLSWNPSTKELTFTTTGTGTDNFNPHPNYGGNGAEYYYIPVIPKTVITLTCDTVGSSAQMYMFGMDEDFIVPGTDWVSGANMNGTSRTGNGSMTLSYDTSNANTEYGKDIKFVAFRFGNKTANSSTTFSNIKITLKTAVPDEINNAAGTGIEWKMYYDPSLTVAKYNPEGGTFNGTTNTSEAWVYYDDNYNVGKKIATAFNYDENNNPVSVKTTADPGEPAKTGYNFGGWNYSGTTYTHGQQINPWKITAPEITFNAIWSPIHYDIAFNGNGNTSGTAPATIESLSYEELTTLPNKGDLAKTGYTFDGWNTEADGTGTNYTEGASVSGLTKTDEATVTLYAKWVPNKYTAKAWAYTNTAADTATWSNSPAGGTVKINSGTAGATAEQANIPCDSKYNVTATAATGYQFKGWYTAAPTSTATAVSTSETYERTMPASSNINYVDNLYARFDIEKYQITFMRNYNSTDETVTDTLSNAYYNTSRAVTIPTNTGYTFQGWYTARSAGTQMYGNTSPITIKDHGINDASVTYYAQWTPNVLTVAYNANGGSGSVESHNFNYGSSTTARTEYFTAPKTRTVTLDVQGGSLGDVSTTLNSTFSSLNKWNTKADGSGTEVALGGTVTATTFGITEGTGTLYAQWNQTAVTLPAPVKTGYDFKGWYTEPDGNGDKRETGYKPAASEILYAYYTIGTYTLTLYAYGNSITGLDTWTSGTGGTVSGAGNYVYQTDIAPAASAGTGYTFVGWYSAAPTSSGWDESKKVTPEAKMPGVHTSYWARFDVVYYDVTAGAYYNTAANQEAWTGGATGGTVIVEGGGVSGTSGATSTAKVVKGSATKLTATAATGYHFVGWYNSTTVSGTASSSDNPLNLSNVTAAETKYARFDINTSTLTIDPNNGTWNGSTAVQNKTQAYGTTLDVPVPERTGYTFTSWSKSSTFYGTLSSTTAAAKYTFPENDSVTSTITANWSPISYTISYDLDSGTQGTNHPASANYDTAFAVSTPTKEGYNFTGWTVTSGLDTANAKWGTSSSPATALTSASTKCVNGTSDVYFKNLRSTTGSVILTANWEIKKYDVYLHAMTENNASLGSFTESATGGTVQINTGTAGASATATIDHGTNTTFKAAAKTGYTFAGWYSNSAMSTSAGTTGDLTVTVKSAIEYWAKFTVNKYTITFNGNGNTGGSTASMTDRVYGITYTLTQNGFTKTGYSFDGWNTAANGSGTAYADKASVTSLASANGANVTLYAQWKINQYNVTLHPMTEAADGTFSESTTGGTVSGGGRFNYDSTLTISATPNTGYQFDGWFSNAGMTASATVPTKLGAADVELWAKFSIIKYELKVYAYYNTAGSANYQNGTTGGTVKIGTGTAAASATSSINYGTEATITATPATGYNFDGWYAAPTVNSSNVITAWGTQYNGNATFKETKNQARTYYARFTLKSITVEYNANSGTNGSITSATAYYGTDFTINGNPSKLGYKLIGWDESSSATNPAYKTGTVSAATINSWISGGASTKTLYAIWQPYEYDISLVAAYNTSADVDTYTTGTTGGTIAYKSGVTKIKTGDNILDCLNIQANTGYELIDVKYAGVAAPSGDVTNWSGTTVTDETAMGAFNDGSKVTIIAYFSVRRVDVTAYAYSNTAADVNTYTNIAAGGTVKAGTAGAGKDSEMLQYVGKTVELVAAANTGYTFDGWYTDAALTNIASTATSITITVADDSSNANINKRYAKFSINTYNASALAVYYTEGINTATGTGTAGVTGGTVKVSNESGANATTSSSSTVSVQAKYTELVKYEAAPATGYEFAGWYLGEEADILDDELLEFEATYENFMADEDILIQGKFVPVNFIINLNANGGVSGPTVSVTLTYGQPVTFDSTAKPIYPGKSFSGWAETRDATSAAYAHTGDTCDISADVVNRWYTVWETTGIAEIFAVWQEAKYIVILDHQNGDPDTTVEVTLNEAMPELDSNSLPTYNGYTLKGYYSEPGGHDESGKYYNADGTSAQVWNIAGNGKLYAKWVCPVVKDAVYNAETGEWTYIYEDVNGDDIAAAPSDAILTEDGLSQNAPSGAKQITSADETKTDYVEQKVKATEEINLNHYTLNALENLYDNVTDTNTALKRDGLLQIELNAYVAKLARYTDINAPQNKKDKDTYKPDIKLYETKSKVKTVKDNTMTKDLSVIGNNYSKPASNDAATFIYTNKWSDHALKSDGKEGAAVDYFIYTNSRTPVIALEIDDGEVGTSVSENNSSYPTNATVSAHAKTDIVADEENSYMSSAVPATKDINNAWFSRYTKANIGKNYDYNAKEIIYLTPSFTPVDDLSTDDEIIYTITPTDNATSENTGFGTSQIAQIPLSQADSFTSFADSERPDGSAKNSITVCVCYHNSMNGTSDAGGQKGDIYLQMYLDQIDDGSAYVDPWINQMHLFRQSGGASNWEIVMADEKVYPVEDETYKDTGYVLGSFAYVFDATNEAVATSYAEAGNYEAAKDAIIKSIKSSPTEKQAGILTGGHPEHLYNYGVGLFPISGWSCNYYPRNGSYVYAHLIDRWGNVFNKVWKNFNIDDYTAMISGTASSGYTITEDGGSNLATITIGCDDVDFITDIDSTFENDVFTTSGDTFTVITNKPKTNVTFAVKDNAGNEIKGKLPTDAQGNIKLTIKDLCADLSDGAYTFMINDKEVNINACDPALVRSASMPNIALANEQVLVTVRTDDRAIKVQLDENGATRTFYEGGAATVVDNGDGTKTWTLKIASLPLGDHTFAVKGKDSTGWYDSDFVLKTTVINKPADYNKAIISVENVNCYENDRVNLKVETKAGTSAVRVTYEPTGYVTTVYRDSSRIETTEDGNEIWTISAMKFASAGEYEINVIARNTNNWQTEYTEKCKVTVVKEKVTGAIIYNVKVDKSELKRGESTKLTVITNAKTTKIQIVYSGTTTTYSSSNAEVTENEDGTLTWVINKSFTSYGDMDVVFKAKSSLGWTEEETFGTISIVK